MINYTERSIASRKGKAGQYPFHVVKIENDKMPYIVHSFKTLKAAQKKCDRANALAKCFFAYEGIEPFYHYEIIEG